MTLSSKSPQSNHSAAGTRVRVGHTVAAHRSLLGVAAALVGAVVGAAAVLFNLAIRGWTWCRPASRVHDPHWAVARRLGLGPVAVPVALPRHCRLHLRAAYPALRTVREGSRYPRSHARGAPQGWAHPRASRGREDPGLGSHNRLRWFGRPRGSHRPGGGIARFNHCLVDAYACLPRRPSCLLRVGGGYRGDLSCALGGRCFRPRGHPRRVHGRDLWLRRSLSRHFLHRGAPPAG